MSNDPSVAEAPTVEPEVADDPAELAEVVTAELDLTDQSFEFVEVRQPYGRDMFLCPQCEQPIATRKQQTLAKPARFAHLLNDVMKCPNCAFIFSYKLVTTTARVIRG